MGPQPQWRWRAKDCVCRSRAVRSSKARATPLFGRSPAGPTSATGAGAARRGGGAAVRPDVDAFFCGDDQIARGVTGTLRGRGISVPEQVAVVGYDNRDTMTLAARPRSPRATDCA
ncbi:substrate-binding domain-containing protein [Microbispora catharanthi]|uniref:substrate-binding domain-containing protein n=1 Tax=Microbispora catharanthi TaxID=1712871 RepID=UPI0030B8FE22